MKVSLSTCAEPSKNPISLWADLVCDQLVKVDCCRIDDPENFQGSISKLTLPLLDIARIQSHAQLVQRTASRISNDGDAFLLVNIQRAGEGMVRQCGREALLKPGDLAIYSSAAPYELEFKNAFEQTVLIFSAQSLQDIYNHVGNFAALTIGADNAAARMLASLADLAFDAEDTLLDKLQDSLRQTFADTLSAVTDPFFRQDGHSSRLTLYHLARIKKFVLNNLGNPALSVSMIANGLDMSVSHLHRIFAMEQKTVMDWVWEQRVQKSKEDLSSSKHRHISIGEIAYRNGYTSVSHFSKAFRVKFGVSARELRKQSGIA